MAAISPVLAQLFAMGGVVTALPGGAYVILLPAVKGDSASATLSYTDPTTGKLVEFTKTVNG